MSSHSTCPDLDPDPADGAETTVEAIKKLSKLVAVGQTQSTNLITLFSSLPANLAALNEAIERVSISCTTSMSKIEELGSTLARLETIQLALTTDLSLDQQRGTQRTHELEDRVQERLDSLLQGQSRFQDDCEARMVNLEKSLLEGNKVSEATSLTNPTLYYTRRGSPSKCQTFSPLFNPPPTPNRSERPPWLQLNQQAQAVQSPTPTPPSLPQRNVDSPPPLPLSTQLEPQPQFLPSMSNLRPPSLLANQEHSRLTVRPSASNQPRSPLYPLLVVVSILLRN